MKYLLAILCFTALLNPTNAQNIDKKTIIWGETDLLDRRMSTYPSEPNADAVVLDAVTRVRMEIRDNRPQMTVQVHRRIKLFNDAAVATLSKISLPIDIPANRLQMRDMRAQLIDVSDDRQSIPLEELKEGNSQYLIFSQLKSGLLLEYRYEFTTDSIAPLSNWSFQENLPVRRSELWATISPAFDYTPTFLNKEKINTFADAKSTAKVFVATDIPPTRIKTSSLMTSDYPTAVRFQINSVTPIGGNKQVYTATWRDLAQNLYKNEQIGAQYLQKSNYDQIWKAMYPSVSAANLTVSRSKIIQDSLSVDAACSGNPGQMEYQGVYTKTKDPIFHQGPFPEGTNNVGEFLAIVHGLAYLKKEGRLTTPIYSDSKTAQAWVRNRKAKTNLAQTPRNKPIFDLIDRAEKWLQTNTYQNPILKWDTENWGEIPADFGRK